MSRRLLLGVALLVLAAGCGDSGDSDGVVRSLASPTPSDSCIDVRHAEPGTSVRVDLDGDGTREDVDYVDGTGDCPSSSGLETYVGGPTRPAAFRATGTLRLAAVRIPGRAGDLVLARDTSPRGGFQDHLFGYADKAFTELTAGGRALLPFIATDAPTALVSTTCATNGFVVTQATSRGADWTVTRTAYTVAGNDVAMGTATEPSTDLSRVQLDARYPEVARQSLFANCIVGRS